jgi:hypothetical protein
VLKFDDNDVDCERDVETVVFVRVGDLFDEKDCEVVELVIELIVVGVGDRIGVFDGGGRGISKISTTLEYPLEP